MPTLYNGIELPEIWPPTSVDLDSRQVPANPLPRPEIIPIDLGRQLFVDDFLIESTNLIRNWHRPVKHPVNPVMFAQTKTERSDLYPHAALAKCGGVWYDEGHFKMWYMAGYLGQLSYAKSSDGINWERPSLDIVSGTNICLDPWWHPASGTVWIDKDCPDPAQRYKMLLREANEVITKKTGAPPGQHSPAWLLVSSDGVHWNFLHETGPMGDRSTMFHNPFRKKWVQSIRSSCKYGRSRHYFEASDFSASGLWQEGQPVPWAAADDLDLGVDSPPQLYNLDATPYESIMLGFYQILRGPPNDIAEAAAQPKLTELVPAYSRDGFYWHRPVRGSFLEAERTYGSWEYGYLETSGGVCLVVDDELWFYYAAYGGQSARIKERGVRSGIYGHGAVGLAKLRRDGFVSLEPRHPGGLLLTRPVRFSGSRLFVNTNTAGGALRAEFQDLAGKPLPGLAQADCLPLVTNSTCCQVHWQDDKALARIAGQPVRLLFTFDRGQLFSFWTSQDKKGSSGGYIAAGGPGFTGSRDSATI